MFIDTHAHVNFNAYEKDADEVIRRSLAGGVWMINVGSKYENSKKAIEMAEKYEEGVYAAIGLHPIHAEEEVFDADKYRQLVINDRKAEGPERSRRIVAVGEIGLDNKYLSSGQKKIFEQQLELAKELNLPAIIHCRMAHKDAIKTLKHFDIKTGVVHCFTGTAEEMEEYLKLGLYIGFNGIIFKLNLDEAIKKCPLDRILIETDCPYLTPPAEGKDKRNEPLFVKYVVEKIAGIKACLPAGRGVNVDEVAKITTQTARNLFKI